jgi:hypothetical protein
MMIAIERQTVGIAATDAFDASACSQVRRQPLLAMALRVAPDTQRAHVAEG